ncbi:MAG: CPBP family intramembrane glutamic endopeptidase [Phycisphaerales bacterium]
MPRIPSTAHAELSRSPSYWTLSTSPLHVLVFLSPLIALYEFGSLYYLHNTSGAIRTVGANDLLVRFFDLFGATGLHLPAITLVVVLLIWHILSKDSWKIRSDVLAGMALESCVLVLPLLVLGLVMHSQDEKARLAALALENPVVDLRDSSWQARLTLSIGAGLYEELLFRLVMITGIHIFLADVFRVPKRTAAVVACLISAVAFALYHDISIAGLRTGTDIRPFLFLTAAGGYFAALFLMRGFGIVVAAHALYDIVVLVVMPMRS